MRRKLVPMLLLATLSLSSVGTVAGADSSSSAAKVQVQLDPKLRVHPMLQYGAQADPDRVVRLLVQKTSSKASSQAIARDAGATVREEFPFIRTLVLEVPQKVALKLAQNPNVRYITFDAPVRRHSIDTTYLKTTHQASLELSQLWNGSPSATGLGVTVAIVDSGVNNQHTSLQGVTTVVTNPNATAASDVVGHGTHVAGIITGKDPQGRYLGVAPDARLISVQVSDDTGSSLESDLIRGLQWVYDNRATENIKVVNISSSTQVATSYMDSPTAAAVERLWFSGITVVVAAGNKGTNSDATWYPPANDPYVITVGALDTNSTGDTTDDLLASFSSRGTTQDGFAKPDVVAPGRFIVAPLASPSAQLAVDRPDRIVDETFLRLSGTSMSAPMVTGSIALLLEQYPALTPDQIKWLVTNSAKPYPGMADAARALSPVDMLLQAAGTVGQANVGLTPTPGAVMEEGQTEWGNIYWENIYWENIYWENIYWENIYWEYVTNE